MDSQQAVMDSLCILSICYTFTRFNYPLTIHKTIKVTPALFFRNPIGTAYFKPQNEIWGQISLMLFLFKLFRTFRLF